MSEACSAVFNVTGLGYEFGGSAAFNRPMNIGRFGSRRIVHVNVTSSPALSSSIRCVRARPARGSQGSSETSDAVRRRPSMFPSHFRGVRGKER